MEQKKPILIKFVVRPRIHGGFKVTLWSHNCAADGYMESETNHFNTLQSLAQYIENSFDTGGLE